MGDKKVVSNPITRSFFTSHMSVINQSSLTKFFLRNSLISFPISAGSVANCTLYYTPDLFSII